MDRSIDRERRQVTREKPRFRKIVQFRAWIQPRGSVVFRKKFSSNAIGKLAGEDREFPHPFCVPTVAPPHPAVHHHHQHHQHHHHPSKVELAVLRVAKGIRGE